MKKSVNLFFDEEITKLKEAMIRVANEAQLPPSVKKLVIDSTARDISAALQNMTDKEYAELSQDQNSEDEKSGEE
jgi:hypothetical protein